MKCIGSNLPESKLSVEALTRTKWGVDHINYKAREQVVLQNLWLSENVTQSSRFTHRGHFNNLIMFLMSVCDLIVPMMMKLWIYENHIRDVRSEELNERWSSQLYPQLTNNLRFLPKCFEASSCFSFKASTEKLTCGLLHNTQSCYDWKINNIFNFWGVLTAVKPPVSDPTKCQDLRVAHLREVVTHVKCSESVVKAK